MGQHQTHLYYSTIQQLWSLETGELLKVIPYTHATQVGQMDSLKARPNGACLLYAAQYSNSLSNRNKGEYIIVGGGGSLNEAKIIDMVSEKVSVWNNGGHDGPDPSDDVAFILSDKLRHE